MNLKATSAVNLGTSNPPSIVRGVVAPIFKSSPVQTILGSLEFVILLEPREWNHQTSELPLEVILDSNEK